MSLPEPSKSEIKEVSFSPSLSLPLNIFEIDPLPLSDIYCGSHVRLTYHVFHASFVGHLDVKMMNVRSLSGNEPKIHNLTRRHLLGLLTRLLDDHADSRSNPFQEGEDDVILATLLAEASQVLDPDADAAESELGQVLKKTVLRHLGILAHTGSTKFRLKPVSTCWKAILSGYNIH